MERSSRRNLDGAMSPSSEVAFDKVMRHIASKVWNDEKDGELLKELESVLDADTYNAIRTPFQSDVATTTTAVNKVTSSSIQTTHHNIDGKTVTDENIVVEDEGILAATTKIYHLIFGANRFKSNYCLSRPMLL